MKNLFEQRVEERIRDIKLLNINEVYNLNIKQLLKLSYRDYEPRYYLIKTFDTFFYRILNENTGISTKPEYVIKFLKSKFKLKNWQFESDIFNNVEGIVSEYTEYYDEFDDKSLYQQKVNKGKSIILNIPDIRKNIELIKKTVNSFGYYLNTCTHYDAYHHDWVVMTFFPIYDNDVNDIVYKHKYIYHVTNLSNKDSILKNGFIPMSSNKFFNYPKRCHFFIDSKENSKLFKYDFTNNQENKYVIFTLDTTKIKNVDFYRDPNMKYGVITKVSVSKDTIVDVEEF